MSSHEPKNPPGRPSRVRPPFRWWSSALLGGLLLASPAGAQTASSTAIVGVVELFTSQGCASCPDADAALTELSRDERVLALSYHVDYWDYIGWKDPLGSPRNSERQRAYAKAMGLPSVFTPQMIVNGSRDVEVADHGGVEQVLDQATLPVRESAVELRLSKVGSTLHIEADALGDPAGGGQAVLILVTYSDLTTTSVERGENAGRDLVNSRSVRDWQVVGKMMGKPIELDMPIATLAGADAGATGCAVLLQAMGEDGSPGPILAAAALPL